MMLLRSVNTGHSLSNLPPTKLKEEKKKKLRWG